MSSSGRLSPVGQISPSQCSRGGIPTIAAAQVSLATDAAVLRGNVQHDVEVVSESDAELEPPRYDMCIYLFFWFWVFSDTHTTTLLLIVWQHLTYKYRTWMTFNLITVARTLSAILTPFSLSPLELHTLPQ